MDLRTARRCGFPCLVATSQPVELKQGTKQCWQGAEHEREATQLPDPNPRDVVMLLRSTADRRANPVSDQPDAHVNGVLTTARMPVGQP